jgi:PAS domain S-box-containing protein
MALSDPEGIVLAVNPAYCELYGFTPDELIGYPFEAIFAPEAQEAARALYLETFRGEVIPPSFEVTVQRKDGADRFVEARIGFITHGQDRVAMLSIIRDITERKQVEVEREQLLASEQQLRAQAEAAILLRDHILTAVSHDLKNPLTAMKIQIQLGQRQMKAAQLPEIPGIVTGTLEQLDRLADRMNGQITALLDVVRLQLGEQLQLSRKPLDLVALATEIAAEHQETSDRPIVVQASVPILVGSWDLSRLRQVIDNLVDNAVKYSPHGGDIVVGVGEEPGPLGAWAVLAVQDRGLGIPPQDIPHVFERMKRGSNVGEILGTGVGLASARYIVESHGGVIEAQSEEGSGSIFTVRLPLDKNTQHETPLA